MPGLTPLRGELLHRTIQERIKRTIIERDLKPGDPLPPETEMAVELGVSRNSLREAVKALQSAGLIETRHGHGTFVRRFSLGPLLDGWTFGILFEVKRDARTVRQLFEMREVLESALIVRVVGHHSPQDLRELRELSARMVDRARKGQDFVEEDHRFHEVLYRPFGNELLNQLLEVFFRVYQAVRSQVPTVERLAHARRHRRIYEAVASGDRRAAVEAVTGHFTPILAMYAGMPPPAPQPLQKRGRRRQP
ncbi:MAG: FadR family transcriptional regulator [Candidatus Rokubacteria bacterium]|nr:FadR family transcriptional regulator [Candidatus Rokubacteria bacterium]